MKRGHFIQKKFKKLNTALNCYTYALLKYKNNLKTDRNVKKIQLYRKINKLHYKWRKICTRC